MLPITDFPSKQQAERIVAPLRFYFAPKVIGLESIQPERPALYVSNHTIFGLTDGIFLGVEMYLQKDIELRTLVDNLHMEVPFWREMVQKLGMVQGNREICAELMQQGAHILVFPGGRREIFKKKGEAYKLRWENRMGFVRMAVQHGYDIVPVASLGGEETYEIVRDANDFLKTPLGLALRLTGINDKYLKAGELIPPVTKGLGWTGLPKPSKLYIQVGERIPTADFQGEHESEEVLHSIKENVETAFHGMFQELEALRKKERDEPWRWILKRL